jgi:BAI1-associated protein 3
VDKWTGRLSHTAEAILHQHAVQGDLTDLQQAMWYVDPSGGDRPRVYIIVHCSRWIAYSWIYMERSIKARLLFQILDTLVTQWTPASLSKDQEELLAECFSHFLHHSYDSIVYHRSTFPPGNNVKSSKRLGVLLECLALMHGSELFKRLLPFQEPIDTEMVSLIKVGYIFIGRKYDHFSVECHHVLYACQAICREGGQGCRRRGRNVQWTGTTIERRERRVARGHHRLR